MAPYEPSMLDLIVCLSQGRAHSAIEVHLGQNNITGELNRRSYNLKRRVAN